jgi:hypothetical protein
MNGQISTLDEFWPFYLAQHLNPTNRRLHFVGTSLVLILIPAAIFLRSPAVLGGAVIQAYAFAWVGHFFFERNKPATFKYPWLSLLGDFRMYRMMWFGVLEEDIRLRAADMRAFREF